MLNKKQKKQASQAVQGGLKPIPAAPVPPHPFMAPNNYSNMHCDAYQTDAYTCMGPVGTFGTGNINAELYNLNHNPEICPSVTFDKRGRLITVGIWVENETTQHELLLMDPETLDIITSCPLPSGSGGSSSFGGGGYFYLDRDLRAVVPLADGTIGVYRLDETCTPPRFEQVLAYYPKLDPSSSIQSAMPDWSGRLWFVTDDGHVGVFDVDTTTNPHVMQLKNREVVEHIANSFAVDETGGVFIVSDHAMYRFDYDPSAKYPISRTWRCTYDNGTRTKPGQKSRGSGTTPTLLNIGDFQFVAITDNAAPQMHVVVYRREKDFNGTREVFQQAVFPAKKSDTENSLIGVAGTFIVENNYGYLAPFGSAQLYKTTPGMALINFSNSPKVIPWANSTLSVPSVVSKVSIPDGLVYTYSMTFENKTAKWYFTVVDFYTGTVYSQIHTGDGVDFDNHYSAVAIHPTLGNAYVPVNGGIVKISNNAG